MPPLETELDGIFKTDNVVQTRRRQELLRDWIKGKRSSVDTVRIMRAEQPAFNPVVPENVRSSLIALDELIQWDLLHGLIMVADHMHVHSMKAKTLLLNQFSYSFPRVLTIAGQAPDFLWLRDVMDSKSVDEQGHDTHFKMCFSEWLDGTASTSLCIAAAEDVGVLAYRQIQQLSPDTTMENLALVMDMLRIRLRATIGLSIVDYCNRNEIPQADRAATNSQFLKLIHGDRVPPRGRSR